MRDHIMGSIAVLLLAAGCAGHLEDPERFQGDAGPCDAVAQVFTPRCVSCHASGAGAQGSLDLQSPNVQERLVNVAAAGCSGKILVVPGDPASSYLFAKLSGSPACGVRMPMSAEPLSTTEQRCVSSWITNLAPADGGVR